MENNKILTKKIVLRVISIVLMIFSVIFGVTWGKNGYCLGDVFLTGLGLKPWSNGTQGTHYTALFSLTMLLFAFIMYSMTTEKKLKSFRYLLIGVLIIIILANIIF